MCKRKRLIKTFLISGTAVIVNYLINYFLTKFITESVGIEAYGFVSIASTFVSYAQIITIALTSFVVRYISVSYHNKNQKEANLYYSSSIIACVILSLLIFTISLVLILKIEKILVIPDNLIVEIKLLFVFVFLNFVIQTIVTPYSSFAYIKNRLDLTGILKILSCLVNAVVLLSLFYILSPRLWFVGLGSFVASLTTLILSILLTKNLTPNLKYSFSNVSFGKIKDLLSSGIWNSVNSLGNVLNSGLDLLISNVLLSALATGQLSVAKSIGVLFATLNQVTFQPFQPLMIESYVNDTKEKLVLQIKKAMVFGGCFGAIAFAGFYSLGNLYLKLWLANQDNNKIFVLVMLTVFVSLLSSIMQPIYYVYTLTLKNRMPCLITILGGLLNVVSMCIILKKTYLEAYGVVITTAVIMAIINLLFNPIYAARCLKIKINSFYSVICKHIIATVILCLIFKKISEYVNPIGWGGLIISAIIMSIVGILIYMVLQGRINEIKGLLFRRGN